MKSEQIDSLYLIGADATACVYRTAQGGINSGYHVIILEDAVFAGSDNIMKEMTKKYLKDGIEINTVEEYSK